MWRRLFEDLRDSVRLMRATGLVLALALVLGTAAVHAQPRAGECVIGPGLAATLLFPYIEVELGTAYGKTTLVSINNGMSTPALTRVVLWTDWAVPTLAFDVYLRGFDVQTINLRDVLYVDASRNFAQGMEAVGLWADATLFSGTNIFTFYGRYSATLNGTPVEFLCNRTP